MIEFHNVSKVYDQTVALDGLNLTIESGKIIGLIGHNGAGKSTTIKSLVSVIHPTSGEIIVDGQELSSNRLAIKEKIGYVADSPDLFLRLTANEFWELVASSYGMTLDEVESRLAYLLELFDFEGHRYEVIDSFSHGMRQKVFVIGALLSDPEIWVLDEPMTGLDPQASYDLKKLMREHADKGNTVLFSTHVLEVAEQLCDKIAILKKGKLLFYGTIQELKGQQPEITLEEIYLSLAGRQEGVDGEDQFNFCDATGTITKLSKETGEKSIKTSECCDENIDAAITICGDVWSFIWNSWSDFGTFIPSTSICEYGFLILDDFNFASFTRCLQCLL